MFVFHMLYKVMGAFILLLQVLDGFQQVKVKFSTHENKPRQFPTGQNDEVWRQGCITFICPCFKKFYNLKGAQMANERKGVF